LEDSQETGKEIEKDPTLNKKRLRYEIVPLLVNVFYILPFFFVSDAQYRVGVAAMIAIAGFFITMRVSLRFRKRIRKVNSPAKGRDTEQSKEVKKKFTLFFGMIYVFVASLAISHSLETFNQDALGNILLFDTMTVFELGLLLTLVGFFVTAIPFVHAGVIYLATDATEDLTKGEFRLVLQNFTVLFLQVVVLFFMAFNVANLSNFVKLAIALMLIDIVWVIRFIKRRDDLVYIEWLQFNSLAALFLVTALLIEQSLYTSVIIASVLFYRTICDYKSLWNDLYRKRILENF
jgi:hypothetical protein